MADSKKFKPQYKDTDGTLKDLILDSSAISGLFSGSYNDLTDKPTIPDVSNMVTTDTTQTISGEKTFSGTVKFNNSATPTITITKNGSTSLLHTTIGYDGLALKDGTNKYLKMESGNSFSSNFGYKINKGDGVAHYISIPADDGTVALTKDIPDVTGMLTTSNYATTLGNVYQAKGDYVTAEAGKGLSTNDYDATDKTFVGKLEQIIPTLEPTSGDQIEILHQHGGYMKIGSYSPKAEDDNHCWLDITSDGDGWSLEAQPMGETNRFRVMVTTNGTHSMTEDINYEFKQDGLYLNNSKVTFSGSYNDLTNKPTLFSGSYNDLTDKPTIPDVSGKLDKITNQTAAAIVYAASKSGDTVTQTSYQLTSNATGSTAMFRDGNGRTKVATPVNDTEAANKGYVDGKVGSYKITSYTVDEEKITLTVEAV